MIRTSPKNHEKLQKIAILKLKARKLSDQLIHGKQQSLFKGRGMIFNEIRKYQAGDDVRSMHWSVTARLREPHIKLYNEERNTVVWLLIDISSSGLYGTRSQIKLDTIAEIAAVISLAAQKSNCSVGVVFFNDTLEKIIYPQKDAFLYLKIIHYLLSIPPSRKGTNLPAALKFIAKRPGKGSVLFILSDFISNGYSDALKTIGTKHDLIGIKIFDRTEQSFPAISYVNFTDAESGETFTADTSSPDFQREFNKWYSHNYKYFNDSFSSNGGNILTIATDEPYIDKLRLHMQRK
jgi:uncharacterized protein (DUF58 family)